MRDDDSQEHCPQPEPTAVERPLEDVEAPTPIQGQTDLEPEQRPRTASSPRVIGTSSLDPKGRSTKVVPVVPALEAAVAAAHTTPAQRKRAFNVLFVCLLCIGIGQSIMFSILPPLARELGISELQVGAIFSVSAVLWVFMSPFWGRRSDTHGRRPYIIMGLTAYGLSTLLFAIFAEIGLAGLWPVVLVYPMIVAARALYGLLGSGTMPSAQAYVADRTSAAERTSGVAQITAAFGLGTMIGPGLASVLVILGLLVPLYLAALFAFCAAAAVFYLLPERTPPKEDGADKPKPRLSPFDPRIFPFLMVGLVIGTSQAIILQTTAFYFMDTLELSAAQSTQYVGVALSAAAMAGLFAQLVIIQKFNLSLRTLMRYGIAIAIMANLLLIVGGEFGPLVFGLMLMGLGLGLARPGAMSAASLAVRPDEQGGVAGLIGSTMATGHIFGPLIGQGLYQFWRPEAPYMLNTVLLAVMLLVIFIHPGLRALSGPVEERADTGIPEG